MLAKQCVHKVCENRDCSWLYYRVKTQQKLCYKTSFAKVNKKAHKVRLFVGEGSKG